MSITTYTFLLAKATYKFGQLAIWVPTLVHNTKCPISNYYNPTYKAHANINGNEQANALAKLGPNSDHKMSQHHTSTPILHHIIFKKIGDIPMQETPVKGPIRHLEKLNLKYDKDAI